MDNMLDKKFRLNPIFEITPFKELDEKNRKRFSHIIKNKSMSSLLLAPSDARVTVKALNSTMVDFLTRLKTPHALSELPEKFYAGRGDDLRKLVVRLVLDGVLEVRDGGKFLSGVEAVQTVLFPSSAEWEGEKAVESNRIQLLSSEAVGLILRLEKMKTVEISNFLYTYNNLPLCGRVRNRFPDEEAVAEFLGLHSDNTWDGMPRSIRPKRRERDRAGEIRMYDRVWRYWHLRSRQGSMEELNYKVYVSPSLEDLPAAFQTVRAMAPDSGAYSMKMGRNAPELYRSDKLIVYFTEFEDAEKFAATLARRLTPFKPQGVPFSYQVIAESPIVSMGVDPPKKFGEKNSWRRYITDNIALAVQSASRSNAEDTRGYVHAQMRMLGIDPVRWRPVRNDWTVEFEIDNAEN